MNTDHNQILKRRAELRAWAAILSLTLAICGLLMMLFAVYYQLFLYPSGWFTVVTACFVVVLLMTVFMLAGTAYEYWRTYANDHLREG